MSALQMSRVWQLRRTAVTVPERLVLLKLAGAADDDGRVMFLPFATIAAHCRTDLATLRRTLVSLGSAGFLDYIDDDGCFLLSLSTFTKVRRRRDACGR